MPNNSFSSKIKMQKCKNMADEIADFANLSHSLYSAFLEIDREIFVPKGFKHQAYKLDALPLAENQWISSPLTVAKMTLSLLLDKNVDSILEIGCGSGYQAAILAKLIRRVFTIERIEPLLKEAKEHFNELGINNIHTRFDDGQKGWRDYAPFDRILLSASINKIPMTLFEQLKVGGILVAPIEKNGSQALTRFTKTENTIEETIVEECLFVPVLDGVKRV